MIFLKKILVTTDLSPFSLAAMEYATSFGTLYTSRIYLLFVVEGKEGISCEGGTPAAQDRRGRQNSSRRIRPHQYSERDPADAGRPQGRARG